MNVWAWVQPNNKIWKIVSDYEQGFICVYDDKENLIFERRGLPKDIITYIESNLLEGLAINISGKNKEENICKERETPVAFDNPMYV